MPTAKISTTGSQFIAPVYGELGISGSASVTTLQQVAVTMDYDDLYTISLDASYSKILLESFQISGSGTTFTVGWRDSTGDQFKSVMLKIIDEAVKDGTTTTLAQVLENGITATFGSAFTNLIPNLLESDYSFSTSVASDDAASDMRGKLTAGPREVIAQQIPEAHYVAYTDGSENSTTSALPLFVGDKLVFVFDTTNNLKVELVPSKTEGATADQTDAATGAVTPVEGADAAVVADNPYAADLNGTAYSYTKRLIAFSVTVTGAVGEANGSKIAAIEDLVAAE